jgi:hypothetical protein
MGRGRYCTLADGAAAVVIRHLSVWDHDRHAPAFIRPIVEGFLRRLAATGRNNRPQPPRGGMD